MSLSNLIGKKNNDKLKSNESYKNLFKGACVKIKNSQKTFQIVGLNPKIKVCWIREWPFVLEENKTFSLEINQIKVQTLCSRSVKEK